jgi:hypothetical protein
MNDLKPSTSSQPPLKLIPAYLGTSSIAEALQTARGPRILWLEIWLSNPDFRKAYQTACRWYTHYQRLITYLFNRAPLPHDPGPIDFREYRAFSEAACFVYEGTRLSEGSPPLST